MCSRCATRARVAASGPPVLLDESRLRELREETGPEGCALVLSAFAARMRARRSVPRGGLEALARWAHEIRSSAATVGAAALEDQARRVERAADAGDADAARTLAGEIEGLVAATLSALDERAGHRGPARS